MPLEILAPLVIAGILLIVLVVRYSGLSNAAQLHDREQACEIFLKDFAGEGISGEVILSENNRAAFIEMAGGNRLGLVEVVGDRFITRLLSRDDLGLFSQQNDKTLVVKYHDFTHPAGTYKFDTAQDLSRVSGWLRVCSESPDGFDGVEF